MPTLLDFAGARIALPPGTPPLPGKSLAPAFVRDSAIARDCVFFHHEGKRALRMGHWKLVSAREDGSAWGLYNLSTDRCESTNLAQAQPERTRSMEAKWLALDAGFRRQAGPPGARQPRKTTPKSVQ